MSDTPAPPPPGDDAPIPGSSARTEADILADPRLREFLAGYQPLHHDLFLQGYARLLHDLHERGQRYEDSLTYLLHQYEQPARLHLWEIQHKKLFDLECRWRAGQVHVPGARLTADFDDWHEHIEACPVLPPITAEEVALYDAFLAAQGHDFADPSDPDTDWNEYWLRRRRAEYYPQAQPDDDDDPELGLPAWSDFYDLRYGTAALRQLPNQRGRLEERYLAAWRQQLRAQHGAPAPRDPRPHVPTYGPEFDELARELLHRYEPAALLRRFEARQHMRARDHDDDDEVDRAVQQLRNASPGPLPLLAHADWRQGIIETARHYRLQQIRRVLPLVFEDYARREALGIAQASPQPDWRRSMPGHAYFDDLAEKIRAGRVLLGEPDDLDF